MKHSTLKEPTDGCDGDRQENGPSPSREKNIQYSGRQKIEGFWYPKKSKNPSPPPMETPDPPFVTTLGP